MICCQKIEYSFLNWVKFGLYEEERIGIFKVKGFPKTQNIFHLSQVTKTN
jgi:hypothetical protein